ncbi:hypothetical protein LCGC14_2258120, partial [marine sediment metagenome]
MRACLILVLAMTVLMAWSRAVAGGRAYCPRVTSEHNADTTDLKRFRNFHRWKDKTGNDLAIAVWQYLSDYETGIYHFNEIHDGDDPWVEYSHMREPLKMLNVYNMGYCGIFGPTVDGIFNGVGFTKGRSFGLDSWNHCATEIFYDGKWHYFDVDVRGALVKADGTVASLEEVRKDLRLWTNPTKKIEPFFPHSARPDKIRKLGAQYASANVDYGYRWCQGSHTADWYLRPGESFTRYWACQDGRWNHRAEYNKLRWLRNRIKRKPLGMKTNHDNWARYGQGNGLFHYAPDLTSASKDFRLGARSSTGLAPGAEGLKLTASKAEAVFAVFTPFIIVPKVNDFDNFDDDTEASVVKIDAAVGVKLAVSLDNGLSWTGAGDLSPGKSATDLTQLVKGRYGYLLKLTPAGTGKPGELAVRSLTIDTWVQVAATSLPRLKTGTNRLRYDCGDRYDRPTMPMLVLPNVADPEDLKKYAVKMPADYDPKRNLRRIQGEIIVKLFAPPGAKISWLSAGATMFALQGKLAPKTDNRIAYATGEPKDFKQVYKADVPTWTQHWRYNYD